MLIKDLMTPRVATCFGDSSLAEAARQMWESDCGILPVVASMGKQLMGVITDRDIAMAAAMRGEALDRIPVRQCCSRALFTCHADDEAAVAHRLMRQHKVRRLPVVDDAQRVLGIISVDDLAFHALREEHAGNSRHDVAATLGVICKGLDSRPCRKKKDAESSAEAQS
ncbi:MAG: CBS domain-containing protein [Planctomycetes bacterium]|nr:CBS domain-containing protein [Planctomycetota bacterium]